MALMDEIYPGRIKTVEEWMRRVDYHGAKHGTVLKGIGDLVIAKKEAEQKK
jgi:hypothetical protein